MVAVKELTFSTFVLEIGVLNNMDAWVQSGLSLEEGGSLSVRRLRLSVGGALEMLVPPGPGEQPTGPRSGHSVGSTYTQQGLRSVYQIVSTLASVFVWVTSVLQNRLSWSVCAHLLLPLAWPVCAILGAGLSCPVDPRTTLKVRVFGSSFKLLLSLRVSPLLS